MAFLIRFGLATAAGLLAAAAMAAVKAPEWAIVATDMVVVFVTWLLVCFLQRKREQTVTTTQPTMAVGDGMVVISEFVEGATFRNTHCDVVAFLGCRVAELSPRAQAVLRRSVFGAGAPEKEANQAYKDAWAALK